VHHQHNSDQVAGLDITCERTGDEGSGKQEREYIESNQSMGPCLYSVHYSFPKKNNYEIYVSQNNLSLIKFTLKNINIYVSKQKLL